MIIPVRFVRICAVFSVVLLLFPVLASADSKNDLVARVGSVPITRYELAREFQRILPLQGGFHGGVSKERREEIRKQALDRLVERALMVQWAIDQELSVPNEEVDAKLAKLRARYKSREEFEKAAGVEGVQGYRAALYRQLLAEKAEEERVEKQVKISEQQVRAYYEKNKDRFMRPKQFRASHILVRVDPSSNKQEREERRKRAEELLKRARAGEDFYNLAYYNSDDRTRYVGGDLGYFHVGQTVKAFEQALLKLKPGEISDLVRTRFGYHIIKLVEVNEERQLTYEEMAGKIRQQLEKEERERLKKAWLEELKKKYRVEIF
ncbi:peptidyl-prolyl cis-trans isomerase C [Geothermobacter ehrlichii]|uniref:Peptidyl-prolyl cis-trans isomerase C n=1 Tax=Geothermobacter ehrlichii TaxID=213224 RepID=A0A5D3WKU8_9BACT|nr:peptidylprolyl isomerase [Geothermobacter ehrlichii]TYO98730.1 peptidyl-prolyl cis-trans isomerase C [Geothermobacter ehrlichii]